MVALKLYTRRMSTAEATGTTDTVRDTLAANLSAELARQRWSARKAATALGVSHVYVSRRANGAVPMTGSDLVMFSELLDIPVAKLFEGTKKAPTPKGEGQTEPPAGIEPATYSLQGAHSAIVTRLHPRTGSSADDADAPLAPVTALRFA